MSTKEEEKKMDDLLVEIKLYSGNIDKFVQEKRWVLANSNVDYLRTTLERWEKTIPKDANWSY